MGKIMRFASEAYVQSEVENRLKTTEPQDSDIPKVFINGVIPTTKDDVNAELTYISKTSTFHAYITIKC